MKFEILKPFLFLFRISSLCERIPIKTHNIESRFVIEPETTLFVGARARARACVCVGARAPFNPEIVQAGVVKGLTRDL